MLNGHADALVDLAEVLEQAGKDSRAELERALALYEQKGIAVIVGSPSSSASSLAGQGKSRGRS